MNSEIDIDEVNLILSGIRILQDLEVETIQDIAGKIHVAHFESGARLVEQGQQGERLYIIFRGQVEVRIAAKIDHKPRTIRLNKGAVVGEISLLTNKPYSADIEALSDVTALYLDRSQFMALIEQHKSFAETLSDLMSERMSQNGDIDRVGKYRLTGRLGEGNMAIVFNAWDPELEREVAIKMLKYELAYDQEFLQRFEAEARIIASLNHPNIVNVFEVINEFSTSFIVMEKLQGRNLGEILQDTGALGISETRKFLYQVAKALEYAHGHGDKGIVHRDIKPSNIMVDDYGNIKLTDFGISGPPQDKSANMEGTPSYLAPEIINSGQVDGRSDIYAMGVMAFHLLTDSLPFSASSLDKILAMQVNQKPPDIRNFIADIDDEMACFIEQALEKDRQKRIADWAAIRKWLLPRDRQKEVLLESNEMGVFIRLRDTSYQDAASIIHSIRDLLSESDIDYSIELKRSDD